MIRRISNTKFSCRKFIALKQMGQGKQNKIIFFIPGRIREADRFSFFLNLFSFFSTQIIAYCEFPAEIKFSRSSTACLLRKTLKILYAKIRLWKKNKKKLLEELWTIACIQWLLLFIRLNVKGLWVSLEI